jgi:flagellar hook assembly protein FlgD
VKLYPAAPNPFNPHTMIRFSIGGAERVQVRVYDVRGALVRTLADRPYTAGMHEVVWDGRNDRGGDAGSGAYFVSLSAAGQRQNRKVILLR